MNDTFAEALDLIRTNDYGQALSLLKRIDAAAEERAADVMFYRGWCLELLGSENGVEAATCYRQAAVLASNVEMQVNSWFRAGWVEQSRGEIAAAERCFCQAISSADSHGMRNSICQHARYWQAVCWESIGRYLDARSQYNEVANEALDLRMECRYREILCSIAVGDFATALASCQLVDALVPGELNPRESELRALVTKEAGLLRRILCAN